MANFILPLLVLSGYGLSSMYNIGMLSNLDRYTFGRSYQNIYLSDDVVENPVKELNSTYYVLPDGNVPLSLLGVPIDYQIRIKNSKFYYDQLESLKLTTSAAVMIVTEYKTIEQSVEEYAELPSNWQKRIKEFPEESGNATHYVDRIVHGGRAISFLSIQSNVTGDIQIIRKTLKQVLGTTGTVGKGTLGLWKNAVRAVNESTDVRGYLTVNYNAHVQNADRPNSYDKNAENFFNYLLDFPKYVGKESYATDVALYLSMKSLHDLDKHYPLLERNGQSEAYMKELLDLFNDVNYAASQYMRPVSYDFEDLITTFKNDIGSLKNDLGNLMNSDLSIFKKVNASKFQGAFEKYQKGLLDSAQNYITLSKRLEERTAIQYVDKFLTPTRGSLLVEDKEVLPKRSASSAAECQGLCLRYKKCRAVGYSEKEKECLIYYRSTYSAKIVSPEEIPSNYVIYDRRRSDY